MISDTASINPDGSFPANVRTCGKRNAENFRELARQLVPTDWRLVDGLYENLDALLRATTPDTVSSGPRSLLATALRQIPIHIADEQLRIHEQDPDDDSEIATMVSNTARPLERSACTTSCFDCSNFTR